MTIIPYAKQNINEEDIASVVEVLKSDWLTTGPAVLRFEESTAQYCGAKYAVACNSATSALHIAYLAAGLGPGDVLWTSPNTFVATANAALFCGASIDFVDIDPQTYNLSVDLLEEKLLNAAKQGKLPKVVVPVHFAGQPCAMSRIWELSQQYGFFVIEDASHAIGASFNGDKIGSCRYAHMTIFSFHPVKIITTGEGGMVLTNNKNFYQRLMRLRSHGVTRSPDDMIGQSHGDWYYQQVELGFNYRMTDLQAALGSSQLKRIEEFVARRELLAQRYQKELQGLPLVLQKQEACGKSAWHLFVVCIDSAKTDKTRKQIFDSLRAGGIGVNVHYIPVHTQPFYQMNFDFEPDDYANSVMYYNNCLSLPMYYQLGDDEQALVIHVLKGVLT